MDARVRITVSMYQKGRSFVMAGGLVKAYEGHWFVYLHLLCQGLECIGKAVLLAHDYEKYEPGLRTDFGHDLEVIIAEVDRNADCPFLSSQSLKELKLLNSYYKRHMLRYGDAGDFRKESLEDHGVRSFIMRLLLYGGSWGQVFHYEIATLSQLHNPANARVMQANACEFESERAGYRDILAKYDNERPDPFSFL